MKILLTGGEGFIGSWTKRELLSRGYEVISLTNQLEAVYQPENVTAFYGDIRDSDAVTEAMAHADGFIHLAGVLGTAETINNPRPAAHTNIIGGLNVLEAADQYKIPGVNIAVGNYWMNNTYSITKNTVERFASMFRDERGLQVTTVRALNAYGPGQSVAAPFGSSKVRKIMPSFMCRALSGEPIEIYGNGNQVMDMIYVGDVAKSLVGALNVTMNHGAIKTVIEAGSGNPTTVNDIAEEVATTVERLYGNSVQINHLPMRKGEPENSVVLGNPLTLKLVGMDPTELKSLPEGLDITARYFKDYLDRR